MVKGRSLTQPPVQFRGAIAMIQVLAIAGGSEGAIAIKKTQKVKNLPVSLVGLLDLGDRRPITKGIVILGALAQLLHRRIGLLK
jgi:hypothetical protein